MTWHVRAESLVTMGRMEEALVIFDENPTTKEVHILLAPQRVLITPGKAWEIDKSFLMAWSHGASGRSVEITGFLQAAMDCAWQRGLRPSGFDGPQEITAVRAHLADMRKLAMGEKA